MQSGSNTTFVNFTNVVETTTQQPPNPAASTPSLQRTQTSFYSPPSHAKCAGGAAAGWTPGPTPVCREYV